jgi:protein-tyrosine phosphatase
MFDRILLVCTGNICRSPLAEAMLRRQLARDGRGDVAQVRSAGTRVQPGQAADETVLYLAKGEPELAPSLQAHRSRPLDGTLTWWADLILVMEPHHGQRVAALDPAARSKVQLLGRWIRRPIGDPYLKHESVYRETHELIQAAVLSWRNTLHPGAVRDESM